MTSNVNLHKEIIVLGAGGHAKVCIELLRAMGEKIAFCIGEKNSPDFCMNVNVLKGDENLNTLRTKGYFKLFVAIGSNKLRERLANFGIEQGYELVNAISPNAVISPSVNLGMGIAVMAGAVINAETTISNLAVINTGATVDHDCKIGTAVHIAPQCGLAGNVQVDQRSFLGVGCKVIPDISIGENVIIGAGSVVIHNIKNNVTAVGVPAKVIKNN